jgi:hypothetical protein
MLCLNDSIRYDDPSLQRLRSAVEETHTLTALLLAVWPLACTLARHIVESVLAARAQAPTCGPPCRTCGTPLRSKGFAPRQVTSLFGPLRWRRRVGRCPHGCASPLVAPWAVELGLPTVPAEQWRTPSPGLCVGRICPVCPGGTVAGLVQWGRRQPPGGMGVGAAGRGPGDGHAPRVLRSGRDGTATP